jgi:outer membrane receptor protein involved in Fe transport
MKKYLLLIICSLIQIPLFAMNISGKVIDIITSEPLEFVNIVLISPPSTQPISGASTNKDGSFRIEIESKANYLLIIRSIGYTDYRRPITFSKSDIDVGVISLQPNYKSLKEVEVIGQGPQIKIEPDKKIFSVDQNISAAGGSISDALKNIPSVQVDNNGNVSLRNDGNVEIWINGKPSGLTADNRAQILQQMPAESVESVEVMTNPSAKMNAEGSAGVINLVMKKNRKAGYNASLSGGLSYPYAPFFSLNKLSGNSNANISFNNGKLEANTSIGYRQMNMIGGGLTTRITSLDDDTTNILKRTLATNNQFDGLFLRANLDYHFNNKNTLSISGFGIKGGGEAFNTTTVLDRQHLYQTVLLSKEYIETTCSKVQRPSFNGNIDYKHDFDKKGSSITFNIGYSSHDFTFDNRMNNDSLSIILPKRDITQSMKNNIHQTNAKIDYVNILNESSKFETGLQSNISSRLSISNAINNMTDTDIKSFYNEFDYAEQIHAAYLAYSSKINTKLSAQLGFRAEYLNRVITNTIIDIDGKLNLSPLNLKDRLDLFPSAFLSYSLPDKNEIQINYSRRVNRPRGRQINPFRDFSNISMISYGNPNLDPELMSALELNYIKTFESNILTASAFYRFTNNSIQSLQYMDTLQNRMNQTYANISKFEKAGLEFIFKNNIKRFLNFTTSLSLYYNYLHASTYINPFNSKDLLSLKANEGISWNISELFNFMLSKNFSGQITAKYYGPQIINQGIQKQMYSIDCGFRQMFSDRKLILALTVNDILNSMIHVSELNYIASNGTLQNWSQNSTSFMNRRTIGFVLTYNFGNSKPKKQENIKRKEQSEQGGGQDMNFGME